MKITLIQPRWRIGIESLSEPLGLGYIASFLREKGYRDIRIYSAVFDSDKKIISNASKSEVVGITATSSMMPHANFLANKIKENNPEIKIVLGGIHPSALPDETLQNTNIDYVVKGEGEVTFYELLKAIEGDGKVEEVPGVYYRKENVMFSIQRRELIDDLDSLPYPARDLMVQESFIRRYQRVWGKRSVAIMGSRGCPYACGSCASEVIWRRRWRARSPENIVEEMEQLLGKYKIDEVHFEDANFNIDSSRIFELCRLMLKRKLRLSWNCVVYPKGLDEETLKIMKEAGCKTIGIGIESGAERILNEYGKSNVSIEEVRRLFRISREMGLKRIAFVTLGLPGEDFNTIRETKKLLEDIKPDIACCTLLVPFPGTQYYSIAKEKGYFKSERELAKLYYTRVYLPTHYLSRKELEMEYRRLIGSAHWFWRRKRMRFWPVYYSLKTEFLNLSPSEYVYFIYRIWHQLAMMLFNNLYKVVDL